MSAPVRFSFLDEGEALRRLGVDRDTLLTFVREKRLRAYPGVGKGNFYRLRDIDALNAELHAEANDATRGETAEGAAPTSGRKVFDPAYKVHVRLQADLKWYDLEDDELRAWVRELHEDGYARQRGNITAVMARLQRLLDLMDEAAAGWQTLNSGMRAHDTAPAPAPEAAEATGASAQKKPRRAALQMFTGGPAPMPMPMPAPVAPSAPPSPPSPPKLRGRNLPMAGMAPPPPPGPVRQIERGAETQRDGEQPVRGEQSQQSQQSQQ